MIRLRSVIRSTGSFASILKSRFFSESAVYQHARLFRKPLSTRFKFSLSNSVSLMGYVDRPIRVIVNDPDRFGVSTLLRLEDPRDPNRSFRIPLSMWDVIARRCVAHLKPNDHILVLGRLVSYSMNQNNGFCLDYQVKVTDVNYVMAPPSHVLDSQISQEPTPEAGVAREESKNDKIYLWQVFFANPYEWWDNRRDKKNPKQPDFKHKDTGEAIWIDSDIPPWVTRQLQLFDQRKNANKSCYHQDQTPSGRLADWL